MTRPTDQQLRELGASMREIDPRTLTQEDGAHVRWFLGDNATELFAWGEQGQLKHAQLVFARVSVEWSEEAGLVTGSFQSGAATAGGRYDPYLLSVGSRTDPEVCRAARVLLEASSLDPMVTGPLLRAIAEVVPA
ncbi:MAG: hypothetical protein HYZ28_13695 [Myxococcales bacterium]|nr:hypothetical protein [Myxococcales bacterium]